MVVVVDVRYAISNFFPFFSCFSNIFSKYLLRVVDIFFGLVAFSLFLSGRFVCVWVGCVLVRESFSFCRMGRSVSVFGTYCTVVGDYRIMDPAVTVIGRLRFLSLKEEKQGLSFIIGV